MPQSGAIRICTAQSGAVDALALPQHAAHIGSKLGAMVVQLSLNSREAVMQDAFMLIERRTMPRNVFDFTRASLNISVCSTIFETEAF